MTAYDDNNINDINYRDDHENDYNTLNLKYQIVLIMRMIK